MAIIIDDPEFEAILAEVAAETGRDGENLLIDILKRERSRLEEERTRRIEEGHAVDEELRTRWSARPLVDSRLAEEILAYDEHGLPA